jgi:hypothetical protein
MVATVMWGCQVMESLDSKDGAVFGQDCYQCGSRQAGSHILIRFLQWTCGA